MHIAAVQHQAKSAGLKILPVDKIFDP